MGSWANGLWDNDEAADWSYQFKDADLDSGVELLSDALATTDDVKESVFGPGLWTLAVLVGWDPPKTAYGGDARSWAERHRGASVDRELLEEAAARVESILIELVDEDEPGDLDDFWDEDLEVPPWAHQLFEARAVIVDAI